MKLLSKREADSSKALERKLEIEEGRKLAKSVDGLRELASKEQSSLTRFKEGAIAAAKAEIEIFIQKRDEIREETAVLEEQRDALMKPIDARAEEFRLREESMAEREAAAAEHEARNKAESAALLTLRQRTDFRDEESRTREEDAKRMQREANAAQKQASENLRESQRTLEAAKSAESQIWKDLLDREAELAGRERELNMKFKHIAGEERRLSLRERGIIDREETLQREIKRQEKKA